MYESYCNHFKSIEQLFERITTIAYYTYVTFLIYLNTTIYFILYVSPLFYIKMSSNHQ